MSLWLYSIWVLLLALGLITCWLATFFTLPGNWAMIALCAAFAYFIPEAEYGRGFGWGVVIGLIVLAVIGELLELAASALGATKAGGSKRGAALALVGSMIGSLFGAAIGFPVPIIGPLIGVLLCGGAGAAIGAILGEKWKGREFDASLPIGAAAFWGRILGTVAKSAVGLGMVVVALVSAIF
jgi:uncharacterized protein YqgC (DUF456 family)